ncbi:MAG TPA: MATE family efflux transporter [Bauldia sp.]|nr:MATE family efflux transporter [Bauldia sp.]
MAQSADVFEITHRSVFAIALPMTLAYLTTPLVGVVSLGVIGQLGDPALVGGVSIGGLIFDLVFLSFNFLRSGTTGLVAQALGAGNPREMTATLARATLLALGIGFVILVLNRPTLAIAQHLIGGSDAVQAATRDYWHIRVLAAPMMLVNYVILGWLIGLGRAGYGLLLQIVLNGVNIVCAVLLVHVYGFGVAGTALASLAAETLAVIAGVAVVFRLVGRRALPDRDEILSRAAFVRLMALNRDILIRSFALLSAFAVFTARSAAAGDVVLAANEILMNLIVLAAYFLDGLAAAAEQLTGRAVGARRRAAFDRAVRLAVGWGYAVGGTLTLLLLGAGGLVVDLMTTSEPVRMAARGALIWAALFPLCGTLAYQLDGVFIGATWSLDMRNTMLFALAVYLAAGVALGAFLGITGWWIALLVFLLTRGASLLWRSRVRVRSTF